MTCRTADEAYAAGTAAAAADPPLTTGQVTRIVLLLAPYRAAERAA
jgi:hypothetical protein